MLRCALLGTTWNNSLAAGGSEACDTATPTQWRSFYSGCDSHSHSNSTRHAPAHSIGRQRWLWNHSKWGTRNETRSRRALSAGRCPNEPEPSWQPINTQPPMMRAESKPVERVCCACVCECVCVVVFALCYCCCCCCCCSQTGLVSHPCCDP